MGRKKKVRAAHRASVTRTITMVRDMIKPDTTDVLDVPKLKQKQKMLKDKIGTLAKLDEEIIDLIPEDELETEIQQIDEFRERLELTISEVDEFLAVVEPKPTRVPPASLTATMESTTGRVPTSRVRGTSVSPSTVATPTVRSRNASPDPVDPAVTPTRGPEGTPPTSPTRSLTGERVHTTRVKLPKLTLKKFNGDLTKWITFWDTFESSVHNNPELTSIDKFNYLHSLLESAAAESALRCLRPTTRRLSPS